MTFPFKRERRIEGDFREKREREKKNGAFFFLGVFWFCGKTFLLLRSLVPSFLPSLCNFERMRRVPSIGP